jgi:putative addiction module killer protein
MIKKADCEDVRNNVHFKKYTILKTSQFSEWLDSQTLKVQKQINGRLERIKEHGHFGNVKKLSHLLFELKFKNGYRIYFFEKSINQQVLVLVLGGTKHGQSKDIRKAQKIAEQIIGN